MVIKISVQNGILLQTAEASQMAYLLAGREAATLASRFKNRRAVLRQPATYQEHLVD